MSRSLVGVSLLAICGVGFAAACGDDDGQTLATTTGNGGNAGGSTATVGGSGGDGGVQMAGGGGSTSTSSGGAPSDYPDGGYGNQEGDVFPFLTWQGYLSTDPTALATTETWTDTYTSLDLHGSGAQYALIHTTLSG